MGDQWICTTTCNCDYNWLWVIIFSLSWIRGLTKAFVNQKELAYVGHTHDVSDISGLDVSSCSIAYGTFSNDRLTLNLTNPRIVFGHYYRESGSYAFYNELLIGIYPYDIAYSIYFSNGSNPSDTISIYRYGITWSTDSVLISNINGLITHALALGIQ